MREIPTSTSSGEREATAERPQLRGLAQLVRAVGLCLGVGLFVWTLRDIDYENFASLAARIGGFLPLLILPHVAATLLHAGAWRRVLAALGHRASLFALWRTFLAADAARLVMPLGPAVGESLAAYSLKSEHGIPWGAALTSLATKKAWVLLGHATCLLFLFAIGWSTLSLLAGSGVAGEAIWLGTALVTAGLLFAGALTLALLSSRRAGLAFGNLAERVPIVAVRRWARDARHSEAPAAAIRLHDHAAIGFMLLLQWTFEIFETWLILKLLGVDVGLVGALVLELGGSIVKSLAFIVPAGVGVQDASYLGMLHGLGVAGATSVGAAFVLAKRARELAFVALGLAFFATARQRRREVDSVSIATGAT